MIDHSEMIARLHVNIQILQEWNPEGEWQHNPLLLAYLRDRYSLKLSQAEALDLYLLSQVQDCEVNHKYKQGKNGSESAWLVTKAPLD